MPSFTFGVIVTCDTLKQANRVMTERIDHDEDLGFDYTIEQDYNDPNGKVLAQRLLTALDDLRAGKGDPLAEIEDVANLLDSYGERQAGNALNEPGVDAYTYTAYFSPEAWISDNAVTVDPEGQQTWDCTAMVQQHEDYFERLENEGDEGDGWGLDAEYPGMGLVDNDDVLKDDPDAPEWVRNWSGPFTICVTRKLLAA